MGIVHLPIQSMIRATYQFSGKIWLIQKMVLTYLIFHLDGKSKVDTISLIAQASISPHEFGLKTLLFFIICIFNQTYRIGKISREMIF